MILIKNARLHNLKNLDVSIPKRKLVVATGVSGAGKTTLLLDILDKEGRREYLQDIRIQQAIPSELPYDQITGLGPTISVTTTVGGMGNPRSVVGTKSRMLDWLKMLFLVDGEVLCAECGAKNRINQRCHNCNAEPEIYAMRHLSFNSHGGMCQVCEGYGQVMEVDTDKLIPDPSKTLSAICANGGPLASLRRQLPYFAESLGIGLEMQYNNLPDKTKHAFLYGLKSKKSNFIGVIPYLKIQKAKGKPVDEWIHPSECLACGGKRLSGHGLGVQVNGYNIADLSMMTIDKLGEFARTTLECASVSESGRGRLIAIKKLAEDLCQVGLPYLTLFRSIPSLSGGERQRLQLAGLLGTSMSSLTLIIDEPTVGLHMTEKNKLYERLESLRDAGNSILMIEHDEGAIKRADHVIDFGPYGGDRGGEIIYQGDPKGFFSCDESINSRAIRAARVPCSCREVNKETGRLIMEDISVNNVKNVTLEIPLARLVGIAGVSGSGKSSLVEGVLAPMLAECIGGDDFGDGQHYTGKLYGWEVFNSVVQISQRALTKNTQSTPATYLKIMPKIVRKFTAQPLAKERGYTPSHFFYNGVGACNTCKGSGVIEDGMISVCPSCQGSRYMEEILDVSYKEKTICDILNMESAQCGELFPEDGFFSEIAAVLEAIGLGYIRLGQSVSTLSFGERQRLKLAKALVEKNRGKIIYLFDEPTSGLSSYDTQKLMAVLHSLVDKGHSVIIVEHDIDVLSQCDWIIEMGPGAAEKGGRVIAEGTVGSLKANPCSVLGVYLTE